MRVNPNDPSIWDPSKWDLSKSHKGGVSKDSSFPREEMITESFQTAVQGTFEKINQLASNYETDSPCDFSATSIGREISSLENSARGSEARDLVDALKINFSEVLKLKDQLRIPALKTSVQAQVHLQGKKIEGSFGDFRKVSKNLEAKGMDSYQPERGGRVKHRLSKEVDKVIHFIKNFEKSSSFGNLKGVKRFSKRELKKFYADQADAPNIPLIYDSEKREWLADKVSLLGAGTYKKATLAVKVSGYSQGPSLFAHGKSKITKKTSPFARKIIRSEAALSSKIPRGARGVNGCRTVVQYNKPSKVDEENVGIISDFVNGGELAHAIKGKTPRLNSKEKTRVALDLIYGFDAMSKSGLVSRDIKPENVMIERDENEKVIGAKHIDFGFMVDLNRLPEDEKRVQCGTPNFMPPELLKDYIFVSSGEMEKIDSYCLGATLIELIDGALPMELNPPGMGSSFTPRAEKILLRSKSSVNPDDLYRRIIGSGKNFTPQEKAILRVAVKCLDPTPSQRPSSQDMINKLKEATLPSKGFIGFFSKGEPVFSEGHRGLQDG